MASVMVYLVYLNEFKNYPEGMHSLATSGIFGTLPRNTTSESGTETFSLFWDQFFSTALFITSILAICDDENTSNKIPHTIKAVLVGLSLFAVGTAFGLNSGFAVNPARDFAPRMFTLMAGWGGKVFTAGPYYFWIPIVAPMCGSVLAVVMYQLFICNHWPNDADIVEKIDFKKKRDSIELDRIRSKRDSIEA